MNTGCFQNTCRADDMKKSLFYPSATCSIIWRDFKLH